MHPVEGYYTEVATENHAKHVGVYISHLNFVIHFHLIFKKSLPNQVWYQKFLICSAFFKDFLRCVLHAKFFISFMYMWSTVADSQGQHYVLDIPPETCLTSHCSSRIPVFLSWVKGPSIYDVHTEGRRGSGSGGRMWTGGPAPCGRPHRKLKLESTDIIVSSSHAKKFVYFLPEFRLWTE